MDNEKNGLLDGANVGIQNINLLKGTDIGVLRKRKSYDKSTYTRTTKPDGTVIEKIKMNKKGDKGGIVDLQTEGLGLGKDAAHVGISKDASEDAVSFVDSIWGTKQVAGQVQANRAEKTKVEKFKLEREQQLHEFSRKRNQPI